MFNRIRIYTVHVKPEARLEETDPVFLREGFNWWGFLLTLVWALYHRLWLVAVAIVAVNMGVDALRHAHLINKESAVLLLVVMQVFIGLEGNNFIRAKLQRRGYITAGIATGATLLSAEQRFLDHYVSAQPVNA